jgi:hypothetical protein
MTEDPGIPSLDCALLLDTTGSLGTELQALRRHLPELLTALERRAPRTRLGVMAFKDHGAEGQDEQYLLRTLPLGHDRARLRAFLDDPALAPGVGGGGAEAVECALHAARHLRWSPFARRALVLVGDRPPHGAGLDGLGGCPEGIDWRDEVEALSARGVAITTVQVGAQLETSRVYEWIALRTGGEFLRLPHPRELARTLARAVLGPAARVPALCRAA